MKKMYKKFSAKMAIVMAALLLTISAAYSQAKKPWITPNNANLVKNPIKPDKVTLAEARTLYMANCSPCHGKSGKGDGPAAAALKPKPADHTSKAVQGETDGSLFWKISEGHTPMPQYKAAFSAKQRWELVNFIRTLAKH